MAALLGCWGAGSASAAPSIDSAAALTLVSSQTIDSRLTDLTFSTPAISGTVGVRVLLPSGYATSTQRYPVLYLLHGCCDNYKAWTTEGDAEAITAGLPLIVVMPEAGEGGFYTDWYNNGHGGSPMWETFHIDELIPWVDAHYRTIADRDGRAIAGLSMGGFGAMSYAAQYPDLFVSASSFSGAVDNMDPDFGQADYAFPVLDASLPDGVWGLQQTEEVNWRGHNPVDLADNLRGLTLTIRTGNGLPGGPYNPDSGDPIEVAVHHESQILEQTLSADGIASTYQDYGDGNHSWPYWQRDLRLTLPTIMNTFAHPPARPAAVTYTTIDPDYSDFGWSVAMQRSVLEFSTLSNATASGFSLSGSGTGTVTTAADFRPGKRYRVSVTNAAGSTSFLTAAGASRRLTIPVALGPSNTVQEFTVQAQLEGFQIEHATVNIAPLATKQPVKR